MAEHTPGPWEPMWDFSAVTHRQEVVASLNSLVKNGEYEANARLIAAAPELLAALEALNKQVEIGCPEVARNERKQARAAIAKARGA